LSQYQKEIPWFITILVENAIVCHNIRRKYDSLSQYQKEIRQFITISEGNTMVYHNIRRKYHCLSQYQKEIRWFVTISEGNTMVCHIRRKYDSEDGLTVVLHLEKSCLGHINGVYRNEY
jgi:hypothetical protein